jgi:hypothetical protein
VGFELKMLHRREIVGNGNTWAINEISEKVSAAEVSYGLYME